MINLLSRNIFVKTREEIILSMCFTYRHDYGLIKSTHAHPFEAGVTEDEQKFIWKHNDIAPYMNFKKDRKPRRTKEEKQIKSALGYSRVGADAFTRGR